MREGLPLLARSARVVSSSLYDVSSWAIGSKRRVNGGLGEATGADKSEGNDVGEDKADAAVMPCVCVCVCCRERVGKRAEPLCLLGLEDCRHDDGGIKERG